MEFEWKDVKINRRDDRLTAKVRSKFYNEESFITISEYKDQITQDRLVQTYTIYYCIVSDNVIHPKMQSLHTFPQEIDTMEKAKENAETYLLRMLLDRFNDVSAKADILNNVIYHINTEGGITK